MVNYTDVVVNLSDFDLATLIVLILVQVISALCNILIILVILKFPHKKTRQRLLMTNIAFCALIVIFETSVPFFIVVPLLIDVSSRVALAVVSIGSYLDALSLYALSITLTLISCDQYFLLVDVFSTPLNRVSTKWLMIAIWSFSSLISVPFLVKNEIYYFKYNNQSFICYYMTYDNKLQVSY